MKSYLEEDEVQRLEGAATNLRDKLIIRFLYRSGCRVSEALALEVKDVDLGGGTATILHLKARVRLTCPKCGARLGTTHAFCPSCAMKVEGPVARQPSHTGQLTR